MQVRQGVVVVGIMAGLLLMSCLSSEPSDTALVGTGWAVTALVGTQGSADEVYPGTELTMFFGADGNLGGSAGCNSYRGAYEISGESIIIGPVGATRKFCAEPAGVMVQESLFLKALETASVYRLRGDQLELRGEDGNVVIAAERLRSGGN